MGQWIQWIQIGLRFSRGSVDRDTDCDPDPESFKKKKKVAFHGLLGWIWIQKAIQLIWIRNSDKSGTDRYRIDLDDCI